MMTDKNEWERFFDGHAPIYMDNVWTKHTKKEVDFIIEELRLPPFTSILDMGCGTGRHSIELAKRGFKVAGVDISAGMLTEARNAAQKAGVEVEFIHSDATKFKSGKSFDAAICLCEGAFGLLGSGDHPLEHEILILRNIWSALRKGAGLIVTLPSAFEKIRRYTQADVESGKFDPVTMTELVTMEWDSPEGKKSVLARERGFVPTELFMIFRQAGLQVEHIWGGTAGDWGRRKIKLDEIEIMVVARK